MHATVTPQRCLRALFLCAPLLLTGCLAPRDLPPRSAAATTAQSPGLLPLSQIVARAADTPDTPRLTAAPEARVAALQARAARLRGPIIPEAERTRMLSAPDRLR
ncbi:hypothetical protein [Natronohydrobacter thiooxidans]|uniref:hypothetical protein n=1 Tax=Natronohydrobacter thiooxidans TaxID=87172 RepID=UPI0008FF5AA8|nr:hypothetical protein [Natronohydrobacter thiooxidans]